MKELSFNEVQTVSGATIRPSNWMQTGLKGSLIGAGIFTITAFSANAVSAPFAILSGAVITMGFHAAEDILREFGL